VQQWVSKNLKDDGCFGIDPYLTSVSAARCVGNCLDGFSVASCSLMTNMRGY
jgi:hypothetical protein